jgi:hypothetical protein
MRGSNGAFKTKAAPKQKPGYVYSTTGTCSILTHKNLTTRSYQLRLSSYPPRAPRKARRVTAAAATCAGTHPQTCFDRRRRLVRRPVHRKPFVLLWERQEKRHANCCGAHHCPVHPRCPRHQTAMHQVRQAQNSRLLLKSGSMRESKRKRAGVRDQQADECRQAAVCYAQTLMHLGVSRNRKHPTLFKVMSAPAATPSATGYAASTQSS